MAIQDELLTTAKEQVMGVSNSLISRINDFLSALVPTYENVLVFFGAGLWAYWLKSRSKWGKLGFITATIIIYFAFRYIGLGK